MGKSAMCIQMLQILNSGRVYKASELADLLETNPRNIIEYKKELEEAGYYIISIPGKFGGYQLNKPYTIPSLRFTPEEKKALRLANDLLKNDSKILDSRVYQLAMAKVFSSASQNVEVQDTFVIPGVTLSMSEKEILDRYQTIEFCIKNKTVIEIDFLSVDNVVRTRKVEPYKLFLYRNVWFVIGYCQRARDFRYFKLTRIVGYRKTQERFRKHLDYNESDYLGKDGFKQGIDWTSGKYSSNEWIHVKLLLHGRPAMYVKEYIYGRNQVVTAIDKDNTILECDMHYKYETIKFALGLGTDCEVIEPKWLADDICDLSQAVYESYKIKEKDCKE